MKSKEVKIVLLGDSGFLLKLKGLENQVYFKDL